MTVKELYDEQNKTILDLRVKIADLEKENAELHKRIRELETTIKLGNEREAQDIRARFPC